MAELTSGELKELEADLRALRESLAELIAGSREGVRPVDLDEPIGRLSRMDAMQQQEMLAENRRAAQVRQQQVNAALARCAEGEFGDCQACGEVIGYPRLKVNPEAPFCVSCQNARERRS